LKTEFSFLKNENNTRIERNVELKKKSRRTLVACIVLLHISHYYSQFKLAMHATRIFRKK
jgi:hypothetical protein